MQPLCPDQVNRLSAIAVVRDISPYWQVNSLPPRLNFRLHGREQAGLGDKHVNVAAGNSVAAFAGCRDIQRSPDKVEHRGNRDHGGRDQRNSGKYVDATPERTALPYRKSAILHGYIIA